jgi:hypothetical protein
MGVTGKDRASLLQLHKLVADLSLFPSSAYNTQLHGFH